MGSTQGCERPDYLREPIKHTVGVGGRRKFGQEPTSADVAVCPANAIAAKHWNLGVGAGQACGACPVRSETCRGAWLSRFRGTATRSLFGADPITHHDDPC